MTLERNTGTGEPLGPLGLRVGQRAQRTQIILARDVERYAQITGASLVPSAARST